MEFEVNVKQISNGWVLEIDTTLQRLGDDHRPVFYETRDAALEAGAKWLLSHIERVKKSE